MPINPDAVGSKSQPERRRWSSKDSLIYALGVGAGAQDPLAELEFTTENSQDVTQRALPTMPVVLGAGAAGAYASIGSLQPGDARARRAVGGAGAGGAGRGRARGRDRGGRGLRQGLGGARRHRDDRDPDRRRPAAVHHPLGRLHPGRGRLRRRPRPVLDVRGSRARRPTTRSPTRPAPTRRCSTACRATATRCTPTPSSRRWPGSTARSSTGCAPTGSPAGACSTPCAAATRPCSGR